MLKLLLLPFLCFLFDVAPAQTMIKKPLGHSVYDGWQNIVNERISDDGKWVLYVVKPQQGDAALVISTAKIVTKFLSQERIQRASPLILNMPLF